ncbi:MAG: hypothetical protein ABI168_08245, partial [Ginsengibacter sp.]
PCMVISSEKKLRIEVFAAATIHWSVDSWATSSNTDTKDTSLGIFVADIDLHNVKSKEIIFTFFWKEAKKWEDEDYNVKIIKSKKKEDIERHNK